MRKIHRDHPVIIMGSSGNLDKMTWKEIVKRIIRIMKVWGIRKGEGRVVCLNFKNKKEAPKA